MEINRPPSRNSPSKPRLLPFSDKLLELDDAYSQLNLSSPSDYSVDKSTTADHYSIGGGGMGLGTIDPLTLRAIAILQKMRAQNAVNGQVGFGGSHRNPTVGDSGNSDSNSSIVGFQEEDDGGSFLQRKKTLRNQLNSKSSILPRSKTSRPISNSNRRFDRLGDVYASNNSNVSRPNSYTQRMREVAQFLDSFSLGDLRGQMLSLAKEQNSCNLLRKKVHDAEEEEIEMVLSDLILHIGNLMQHQFASHFVQELVRVCNEKQRTRIILSVTKTHSQLIKICLNPYGSRAVKVLLEHITSQRQISLIVSALNPGAAALVNDPNGHRVIECCVLRFSNEDTKYLINEMEIHCFEVATNQTGCCVLQLCVVHSQGESRDRLVAEIIVNALCLAEDRYGNFVVQCLLRQKMPGVMENLLRQLEGSYVSLSCNKYGSNVVERCLSEAGEEQASGIIMELLRSPDVSMLLVHPFGNFVIQTALEVSKGIFRNALLKLVLMNAPYIRSNIYGKKVLTFIEDLKLQHT